MFNSDLNYAASLILLLLALCSCATAQEISLIEIETLSVNEEDNRECREFRRVDGPSIGNSVCLKAEALPPGRYMAIIKGNKLVQAFNIEVREIDGSKKRYVNIDTRALALPASDYYKLVIPEVLDNEGNHVCVVSGVGVIVVEKLQQEFRSALYNSKSDNFLELEKEIKSRQPWCDKQEGQ